MLYAHLGLVRPRRRIFRSTARQRTDPRSGATSLDHGCGRRWRWRARTCI